jgi:hypothetical protein
VLATDEHRLSLQVEPVEGEDDPLPLCNSFDMLTSEEVVQGEALLPDLNSNSHGRAVDCYAVGRFGYSYINFLLIGYH